MQAQNSTTKFNVTIEGKDVATNWRDCEVVDPEVPLVEIEEHEKAIPHDDDKAEPSRLTRAEVLFNFAEFKAQLSKNQLSFLGHQLCKTLARMPAGPLRSEMLKDIRAEMMCAFDKHQRDLAYLESHKKQVPCK